MIILFNLMNASVAFQSYINKTFYEYLDVFMIVYLNDIMIYSSCKENHERHVCKILEILIEADFYVKLSKYYFSTHKIDFLNYQVFTEEIFMKLL